MIVVKKYDKGGKFSLRDLIKAYKDTKPERGEYSYGINELGNVVAKEDFVDDSGILVKKGDDYTKSLGTLSPEGQEQLYKSGKIHNIRERRGGASPTGGGGVTILKGKNYKKKYEGTEGGGLDVSYRKGTMNPFKRLKAALQSLKVDKIKEQNVHSNPRFL